MALTARQAYGKGWAARGRRGALLGPAEDRFRAQHGDTLWDAFTGGFLDRNSDRPMYHDFTCPLRQGETCEEEH